MGLEKFSSVSVLNKAYRNGTPRVLEIGQIIVFVVDFSNQPLIERCRLGLLLPDSFDSLVESVLA
jgi:hypothetical protein